MSKIKAVIFDIDGTLSPINSWHWLAERLGGSVSESMQLYLDHKAGKLGNEVASNLVYGMWTRRAAVKKDDFIKILEDIPLRDEAVEVSKHLKSNGIKICLITGSNDMYAEIVAEKIDADDFYANAKIYWNDGNELEKFTYDINQGAVKLGHFNNFLKKRKLKSEDCVPIGDSENDRELFQLTKKGIALRTKYGDKELEALAWKVIDNLAEIKEII